MIVEGMREEDVLQVQAIEAESFPRSWPAGSFSSELKNNRVARYIVAREGDRVLGYAGMWLILDEAHITTIAVDPAVRGQKVGKRLLWELLRICVEAGTRWAVLEVRETNQVARQMYERFGFKQIGLRKGYYDYEDNALVLWVGQMQSAVFREVMNQQGESWGLKLVPQC
ncbi:MAG: ribosomal protein S18-alanine N-acetyltransferase [Candidatus Xenobia bacterium]